MWIFQQFFALPGYWQCLTSHEKRAGLLDRGEGGLFFGRDGSVPQNKVGVFFWQERVKFVRLAVQMLKISLVEMQKETSQS